jgi:hypothetical protein
MANELDKRTIDALRERADDLTPENVGQDYAEWEPLAVEMRALLAYPTVDGLRAATLTRRELVNMLDADWLRTADGRRFNATGLAIEADLLRAGGEKFDPEAVSTHRPRTRVVDGVRYEALH